MASLNEFGLQSTAIEEWLPWGGIVRPSVMKQKDGSMFSVITYAPYTTDLFSTVPLRAFCRGWVLWNEHQHVAGVPAQDYLIIGWNPFEAGGRVENALRPGIMSAGSVDYFDREIHHFVSDFQKLTQARLLEYQEIMDVLSFSLSMGEDRQEMPDCPLYMDALLSQNITFAFGSNDVFINGKRICVLSLFAPDEIDALYQQFEAHTYRHTRRLLLFSEKQAKRDFLKYTSRWFPTRSVIRHMATDDLFGDYNGYYTDTFLFPLDEEHDAPFQAELRAVLNHAEIPYIVEEYNLKEVFWGSIPGIFLANAHPPITGFGDLSEFLHATIETKEEREDVLKNAESHVEKMSALVSDTQGGNE